MSTFDEVQFPTNVRFQSSGGPMRQTQIVVMGSGGEQRNARWVNSRRTYRISNIQSDDDAAVIIDFFEARNGRLRGFRFKDWLDYKSCRPQGSVTASDQDIGTGTGTLQTMQLTKKYTSGSITWTRDITKPVSGTVKVAYAGVEQTSGWSVDTTTGEITVSAGAGVAVTAGFEFDVPVRFDTDNLQITWSDPLASQIQDIPLIELPS